MHPTDIQNELKKRGITQASIAQELGVTTFHLSACLRTDRRSDRVRKAIARKIDRDPREAFPDYEFVS